MTLTHGNDPEILDGIGDALHVEADRVEGIAGTGTSGMAVLVESWAGPDLEAFDADWRGARQRLDAAAQLLRAVGERAKEQAQQQREGSGEGGGGKGTPAPVAPIKYDTPPDSGGGSRQPQPEDFELTDDYTDGAKIPLVGTEWVPQGVSFDERTGLYVYTYYHEDQDTAGKMVFADEDGNIVSDVSLAGIDHYGGVYVNGDRTYVSGDGQVQIYDTQELRKAGVCADVTPIDTIPTDAHSSVTVHDGHLYVSQFLDETHSEGGQRMEPSRTWPARGSMYKYELNDDGSIGDQVGTYEVPPKTQGVSFDEAGNAYFTSSYGRWPGSTSDLYMVPADKLDDWSDDDATKISVPKMSEGSFIKDGQLHQLYESGADKYDTPLFTDPRDRLTVHDLRK
ncbi:hypothetical protein ASG73_10630 [Janibacter sp. Soil728]|uniref:WXG100 family type VII secretion target n=1 Tax=Janibacter sp. Soil728 TaxID=1736393 RepID=UPI0006FA8AFD|nr:hypothetical protein [Janibacter sp. Soil728]KRE38032.1 hypothetical protein ASG73_10630 [Janibacter sp. Soil728]